jgi:bifunctional DNA-binding transcriptional regulator/antitoxin component of YhaV-PrlF toxin-antitoxin module
VREELQLGPGDVLELKVAEDQIVLRPARGNGQMKKEQGVWVFDSGTTLNAEIVRKTRKKLLNSRNRKVLGRSR